MGTIDSGVLIPEGRMAYKTVEIRHIETPAPHIKRADLVTMTEAADLLGSSISYIRNLLDLGKLKTVIDDDATTPHGTPKRYLMRDEVLRMREGREAAESQ